MSSTGDPTVTGDANGDGVPNEYAAPAGQQVVGIGDLIKIADRAVSKKV